MNILISGCGIAGLTAVLFLQGKGHEITIIERARSGDHRGYGLSIKGFGVQILRQLNLYQKLLENELVLNHYSVYDRLGRLVRKFSKSTINDLTGGTVAIARSQLHRILFDGLHPSVKRYYGRIIASVTTEGTTVVVVYDDGTREEFDLVIVAEGIRSSTRRMLWGGNAESYLDVTYVAGIIGLNHSFPLEEAKTFKGVGRTISFFPVSDHLLAFQAAFRDNGTCVRFSKHHLLKIFSGFTNEVTHLVSQINHDQMYFDQVGTIRIDTYVKGRIVLLGDAAHCPSFLSGMGASLSMLGAKLLAFQINDNTRSLDTSLDHYGKTMQALAEHFQKNAFSNMKREIPDSVTAEKSSKFMIKHIPITIVRRFMRKQLLKEVRAVKEIVDCHPP